MLNKKLSIIIVNYKSVAFLKKCIDSIYKKFPRELDFEIIVVNNDEKNLDNEITDNQKIKVIENKKNIGFGMGNNVGAEVSRGDVLFFLNPDTEILSSETRNVISLFNNNKKLGVVGAKLYSDDGKIEKWSLGNNLNLFNLILNNLGFSSFRKFQHKQNSTRVGWVSAAAFFIKKDVFDKVGGFDEKFFMYFEDMDLCNRVKKSGKDILYFPSFKVRHYGGKSYRNKKIQKKDFYHSQKYYFQKHRNVFEYWIIKIVSRLFYNV